MRQLFLALLFINLNLVAQTGDWKYADGWIYVNKQEDPTAGGAILTKKITNNYNIITTDKPIRQLITPTKQVNNEKITKIGVIGGEDVYFTWDEKKVFKCLIARMEGHPYINASNGKAGTPEPNTSNLLFIGFSFLLVMRSLSRKEIKI